jgi:tRNA (Thr-GGU) A37 N-methylase
MEIITYTPIGVIGSPYTALAGMPIQTVAAAGIAATIELEPSYAAGLKDIDAFSYLLLITHWLTGWKRRTPSRAGERLTPPHRR